MTMRTKTSTRPVSIIALFVFGTQCVLAQWNTGGGGQQYLTSPTRGVTVGTNSGVPPADLSVFGSEMNTQGIEQFRSIGYYNSSTSTEMETNWRMFRLVNTSGTTREMGRLYAVNSTNGNNDWHLQQMSDGASLYMWNYSGNGMRIWDDGNPSAFTYNSISNRVRRVGYAALGYTSAIKSSTLKAPWSRVHLVHHTNSPSQAAYRSFMRNGVTMTGNGDAMYVGQKNQLTGSDEDDVSENTDALYAWWDDDLPLASTGNKYDNATFRFLTTPGASNVGSAGAVEGLEMMRLRPYRSSSTSAITGYVGIGDWASGTSMPEERLDLLDRTIRLRAFTSGATPSYQNDVLDRVLVADPANGTVYWRAASTLGAPGCQWTMNTASPNHVYTAVGASNASCPDDAEAVGIGVIPSSPTYKLGVANSTSAATTRGIQVTTSGGTATTRGIEVTSTQSSGCVDNRGMQINALSSGSLCAWGNINYGLRADVTGNSWYTRGFTASVNGGTGGWSEYGGEFLSYGNASYTWGVLGLVDDGTANAKAVEGANTANATNTWGVLGSVNGGTNDAKAVEGASTANATTNYGVSAIVSGTGANTYYGVYGSVANSNTASALRGGYFTAPTSAAQTVNSYALWAQGDVVITGTTYPTSDQSLKDNIEDLTGSLEFILQLQPKRYTFRQEEFPFLNLSGGSHLGLVAQDVEALNPELVRQIHRPADIDSLGNVINPAMDFKGLNYIEIIPLLIGAVKEQNATITGLQAQVAANQSVADQMAAMQEQLNALQEQLAACCASGGMAPQGGGTGSDVRSNTEAETIMGNARNLLITPNPFVHQATLTYTLDHSGRMHLLANSADGKQLRVLSEASMEAGQYTYEWDTTDLAPGVYYVTLLLDSEQLVKKAVRVKE